MFICRNAEVVHSHLSKCIWRNAEGVHGQRKVGNPWSSNTPFGKNCTNLLTPRRLLIGGRYRPQLPLWFNWCCMYATVRSFL